MKDMRSWAQMCDDVEFDFAVIQRYLDDSQDSLQSIDQAINQLKQELGSLEVEYASLYSI